MTKNKILSGTVIAAIAAILLAWAPSAAYAGDENPNAATVITGLGCFLASSDGGPGSTDDSHHIENKNFVKFSLQVIYFL